MQFTLSNNPRDKLDCWLHNKREDLSGIIWSKGKQKTVECRICGDVLDSKKDLYSPTQRGWHKVDKYSNWICHNCFDHRNFVPFIEMIDEENRKEWEEHNKILEQIRLKAQKVIDLLKEYLPEYKETLDLYYLWDLDSFDADGYPTETDFSFTIEDKDKKYVLEIRNSCILKVSVKTKEIIEVANYLDEEIAKQRTYENPWTWDDAIEVIKKRLEIKKNES